MQYIDIDTAKQIAQRILDAAWNYAVNNDHLKHGCKYKPTIRWHKFGFKTIGRVVNVVNSEGKLINPENPVIELNVNYLSSSNFEECLPKVVLHELAHVIADRISCYIQNHNTTWQFVAKLLGVNPTPNTECKTPDSKPQHMWKCNCCGKTYFVSTRKHNHMLQTNRYKYKCPCCNSINSFVNVKTA